MSSSTHKAVVCALPIAFRDSEALVAAIRHEDPAAARAVWDRYSATVRAVVYRMTGHSDLEDLVQETFLRLFRLISKLRDPSQLRSFVLGIAVRVAREQLRRRKVRRWVGLSPAGDVPEIAVDPVDDEAQEALRRLDVLLNGLDEKTRLIFVLRHVEGISAVEVAEIIGVSLATAKRRIKRASGLVRRMAEADQVLRRYAAGSHPGGNSHAK